MTETSLNNWDFIQRLRICGGNLKKKKFLTMRQEQLSVWWHNEEYLRQGLVEFCCSVQLEFKREAIEGGNWAAGNKEYSSNSRNGNGNEKNTPNSRNPRYTDHLLGTADGNIIRTLKIL